MALPVINRLPFVDARLSVSEVPLVQWIVSLDRLADFYLVVWKKLNSTRHLSFPGLSVFLVCLATTSDVMRVRTYTHSTGYCKNIMCVCVKLWEINDKLFETCVLFIPWCLLRIYTCKCLYMRASLCVWVFRTYMTVSTCEPLGHSFSMNKQSELTFKGEKENVVACGCLTALL